MTVGRGGGEVATNTAVGTSALNANTSGANNTAVGYQAGYTNSTGAFHTFIGYQAGYTSNCTSPNGYNVAVGYQAGYAQTLGNGNTFVGPFAGNAITTGNNNTIIGGYGGNSGGLDIRTSSSRIVLSDGGGNPRLVYDNNGAIQSTSAVGDAVLYPAYFCRAWVNFNGTGTVAIRSSGNITSITDYGTGDYAVTFTTAMPDINYASTGASVKAGGSPSGSNSGIVTMSESPSVNGQGVGVLTVDGTAIDRAFVYAAFFR